MPDQSPHQAIQEALSRALATLERLNSRDRSVAAGADSPELVALKALVKTALVYAQSAGGMGECRRKAPFSPLRPVLSHDGKFTWCCNHDPEHCVVP